MTYHFNCPHCKKLVAVTSHEAVKYLDEEKTIHL